MLKRYKLGDLTYWYEEGCQPDNAILLDKEVKTEPKTAKAATKEVKPKNKSKGVVTK